ncbi:MAG TPA: aldehyde dehydrogenase [Actinomycetes bacterium]|nr:aldehyde dehydrogenase [Actinomycetes bacterium]
MDWHALAGTVQPHSDAFVDGRFVPAVSGDRMKTINPATDDVLVEVAACSSQDVDTAVSAARRAFEEGSWSGHPEARSVALQKLADLILENREEFALLESLEMGKRVVDAYEVDVPGAAAVFRFYAGAVDKVNGEVVPTAPGNLALVTREPIGVVAAVVPWNFPLDLAAWKVAPALAAGNTVVLKPAEQSSLSALRLAELAVQAGIPAGVLNVVPGYGEQAGRALGMHNDVDVLAFTGSTEVGRLFLSYSAQSNGKPVWPECGGKSPNLVFADASSLDEAADMACFGIFFNQGEVCSANSRLLVESSVADVLVEKILERTAQWMPGDPLDPASGMGALVSQGHLEQVATAVDDAVDRGAKVLCGGERSTVGGHGCFYPPTILTNVEPTDPIASAEVFGPVLIVTPFESEAEAVAMANDSPYGLAASVWTGDLSRAHRVAGQLNVGTVSVNTVDALSPQTPFGGVKQSGFGRDLSVSAMDKYTALKTTWIKFAATAPVTEEQA